MSVPENLAAILPDEEMRSLGFTDHVPTHWRRSFWVGTETFFSYNVNKTTGEWKEAVIDEVFGQYAPFGHMNPAFHEKLHVHLREAVAWLRDLGFTVVIPYSEYGCSCENPEDADGFVLRS